MRYEYLIGLRYLRARRRERFVSLIAIISLAGVAIGTFALTVVLSVMSGFQEDLRSRLLAFNPEITVDTTGQQPELASLQQKIRAMPGVVGIAPFTTSQVLAVSTTPSGLPAYVAGGTLRGVLAAHNPVLAELKSTLESGSLEALDQMHAATAIENGTRRTVQLPGVIVGKSLAEELGLGIGAPVIIISPTSIGAGAGTPRLKRFVVVGVFHSGMYEYDSSLMFVGLKNSQALLAEDPQLETGLEIRVQNLFDAPAIAAKIAMEAGGVYKVADWTQTDAPLFSALKLEKFTYFLVLLLIVLVAAFNIVATLVMVVMERRKEIAILRAIGARAASIATIFLCEGAALGVVGTMLGVTTGFVTAFLIGKYHLIHLPPDMFMVSVVPVRLYPINFIAVAVAAIALCLCGAIYPALQARALRPVEIIRYE
ncbi:MAG: ABC transporter permease [Deltaproteobacteria bacterium]|nr:ABC transporter permease [Deltaproteobacteria bacterium]